MAKRKISQREKQRRSAASDTAKLNKYCTSLPLYHHMVGNMLASGCKIGKAKKIDKRMLGVDKTW